jgi:hypothetical protein
MSRDFIVTGGFTPTYNYSTSNSSNFVVTTTTTASAVVSPPPAKPRTSLDWLDDQIEATCKLARKV